MPLRHVLRRADDLTDPGAIALLEQHVAQLRTLSSPESVHALDLDGLRSPTVRFWATRDSDGAVLGCGALALLNEEHRGRRKRLHDPRALTRGDEQDWPAELKAFSNLPAPQSNPAIEAISAPLHA